MSQYITQISIYRSRVPFSLGFVAVLQHAAVHIVVDGITEIWEYGMYHRTNGILTKRDGGKQEGEQLIVSCRLQNPLEYLKFVNFSIACCQGKTWGYRLTQKNTSCQFYALQVLRQFTNSKCVAQLNEQIEVNWKSGIQQAIRRHVKQHNSTFEEAKKIFEEIIDKKLMGGPL